MDRDVLLLDDLPDLGPLLGRAALGEVASKVVRPKRPEGLPARTVMVLDHAQGADRLAAYARVCGFTMGDAVPATWLHVLTFPLQAALMAERDFPFGLAGLVHLANDMTLHRPVTLRDRLRLQVSAEGLVPHRRGVAFDLVGEVFVGGELAWQGRSTYLARGATTPAVGEPATEPAPVPPAAGAAPGPGGDSFPPTQVWRLPADLGRRYAAASGDVNPIHLYPLTARLFGFPRPLAHGMWTHARALAALGGHLPATYGVGVRFTKPILLPATVGFGVGRTASGWGFAATNRDGSKQYLVGEVRT